MDCTGRRVASRHFNHRPSCALTNEIPVRGINVRDTWSDQPLVLKGKAFIEQGATSLLWRFAPFLTHIV